MTLATVLFQNLPTVGAQKGRGFPSNESGRLRIQEVPIVKLHNATNVDFELRPLRAGDPAMILFVDMDDPWKVGLMCDGKAYRATTIENLDGDVWNVKFVPTPAPALSSMKWEEAQEIEPGLKVWYNGIVPSGIIDDAGTVKVKVLHFHHRNIPKDMIVQSGDISVEWYDFQFQFVDPLDLVKFEAGLSINLATIPEEDKRDTLAIEFDGGSPFNPAPIEGSECDLPLNIIKRTMWGYPGKLPKNDPNVNCRWTGRLIVAAKKY